MIAEVKTSRIQWARAERRERAVISPSEIPIQPTNQGRVSMLVQKIPPHIADMVCPEGKELPL